MGLCGISRDCTYPSAGIQVRYSQTSVFSYWLQDRIDGCACDSDHQSVDTHACGAECFASWRPIKLRQSAQTQLPYIPISLTGSSGSDEGAGTRTMSCCPPLACLAAIVPSKSTRWTVPGTGRAASSGLSWLLKKPMMSNTAGAHFAVIWILVVVESLAATRPRYHSSGKLYRAAKL